MAENRVSTGRLLTRNLLVAKIGTHRHRVRLSPSPNWGMPGSPWWWP